MRRKWLGCAWVLVCLFAGLPASAEVVDRIVAIVNSDIITQFQLDREAERYKKQIEASFEPEEIKKQMLNEIHDRILTALIDQSLTRQEAQKYQIQVTDPEVDAAIENLLASRSLGRQDLEKALRQEGVAFEEYRDNVRKQILQSRLIHYAVKSKVVITDEDIRKEYEENLEFYGGEKKIYLKNILLTDSSVIETVRKKLAAGEEFETLARAYSMAPNASEGGDLGVFDISSFSEEIKRSIVFLKKGEYSDVIQTAQGFQIFYVADILDYQQRPLEEARAEIYELLYQERVEEKFEAWFESLKKKAHIRIML